MKIVNPTFGQPFVAQARASTAGVDWVNGSLAIFSNSKPHAVELLRAVAERVGQRLGRTKPVGFFEKEFAAVAAAPALLAEMAANYAIILVGIGD